MPEVGGVDLSKKVGPVPIWVIVVAGGLGIAYVVNRQFGAASGGGTVPVAVEPGVGGTPGGFIPAPQPEDQPILGPLDNEEWAFNAVVWLVGQGYNPVEAGIAVRKYLDGEKLTVKELSLITLVVKAKGAPPNIPVGGGVITPTPSPSPTPVPTPKPPSNLGKWMVAPRGAVPANRNGTSAVLDWIMKHSGWYPRGVADATNRARIWYHPANATRRAIYGNDWTKLRMLQWVFVPGPV